MDLPLAFRIQLSFESRSQGADHPVLQFYNDHPSGLGGPCAPLTFFLVVPLPYGMRETHLRQSFSFDS